MAISKMYVIQLFESNIASQTVIPDSLENVWFERAVIRYGFEVGSIEYDKDTETLHTDEMIDADILALYMRLFFQEREYGRIGMRGQIVTKDISLNGGGAIYTAAKNQLDAVRDELADLVHKRKHPSLYTLGTTQTEQTDGETTPE